MQPFFVLLDLLLLLSALHSSGPQTTTSQAAQVSQPGEQLGRISGRVLRADTEQPLSKAIVTLVPVAQPVQGISTRTDSGGRFQFDDVMPGTYRLRAQRNGYVTLAYGQRGSSPGTSVAVNTGQSLENIDFRLPRAGVIAGVVLDEDMEPVEGLPIHAVRLRFAKGGRLETSFVRTTQTDDAGEYRLPGLSPGFYLVQAGGRGNTVSINLQAPPVSYGTTFYPDAGSRDDASRVQVAAGEVVRSIDIRVRSSATYTISGVIVDGGGGQGSKRYSVGFAMRGGTATAQAQPDGSFAFHGVAAGDYTLVGSVSEEAGPTRRGYVHTKVVDSDVRVAIEIGRTAELQGEVRMDDGKPFVFDGLRIELTPDHPEAVSVAGPIDSSGLFRVRSIPTGPYNVQLSGREDEVYLKAVRCAGENYTEKAIALAAEERAGDCILTLSREVSTVSGTVMKDEKPVDGMVVVLVPENKERRRNPRHTMSAQTDEQGVFQIKGVIPGDYLAFAVPPSDDAAYFDIEFPERNREHAVRITIRSQEPMRLKLQPAIPR
jgi:hypothetical protein